MGSGSTGPPRDPGAVRRATGDVGSVSDSCLAVQHRRTPRLGLYQRAGFGGFHIDFGAGQDDVVEFANQRHFPYYVDHAAGKGILYLTERTGRDKLLNDGNLAARPQSLAEPDTWERLVRELTSNLSTTRRGPMVAAAFDDEISLGVFTSPHEVDASPASIAMYRQWLRDQYRTIEQLNLSWHTQHASFADVQPVPFGEVREQHQRPPFSRWNLAPWMDWRCIHGLAVCRRLCAIDPGGE